MSARFPLSLRLFFTTCLCLCVCLATGCSGKQVHVTVENEFNMMAKRLAPVLKAHGVIDEHGAYVAPVFSTPELPPQLGEYLFQRLSPAFRFKVDPALLAHFMSHPFFDRPVPRSGWSQGMDSIVRNFLDRIASIEERALIPRPQRDAP